MKVSNVIELELKTFVDERGVLSVVDEILEFQMKRFYWLHSSPSETIRGLHAHKKLNQIFFPISGSAELLLDDGDCQKILELSQQAKKAFYVPAGLWRRIRMLSAHSIVGVAADTIFVESDYIYSFEEFIRWKKQNSDS